MLQYCLLIIFLESHFKNYLTFQVRFRINCYLDYTSLSVNITVIFPEFMSKNVNYTYKIFLTEFKFIRLFDTSKFNFRILKW